MVTTVKFSSFESFDQANTTNALVGFSAPTSGQNIKLSWPIIWTTATRPTPPYAGLIGYNSSISDYEYYNSSSWVPFGSGASGTVTQINTGVGLTGGPITETGTISFAAIAANSLWANVTGSGAVPTVIPTSTFLMSANNLSDLPNKVIARANLGVAIGTNVEAWSAILDQISAGTWLGADSITTLGTIAFGAWHGSTVDVPFGGTGNTTFTAFSVICAGSTATGALQNVSGVGSSNQVLVSNGPGVLPSWQNVPGLTGSALTKSDDTNVTLTLGGSPTTALLAATSLTLGWTGQLGLTRGGTNANLTASNGGIVYSNATALAILAGTATANQALLSGTNATPSWSTATYPPTTTASQILYSSSNNVITGLATANNGVLTTNGSGVPSISALSGLGILSGLVKTVKTQVLTGTSGTYTPSTGMLYCTVYSQGGGGGGGGSAQSATLCGGGGGGGAGGLSVKTYTAALIGATAAYVNGAAGAAGSAGANAGVTGGNSTFTPTGAGAILTANGGVGGDGSPGSAINNFTGNGGLGGTASNGDLNIPGMPGFSGLSVGQAGTSQQRGGNGGSSQYGSGGIGSTSATGAGGAAFGNGAGGGSGASAIAGTNRAGGPGTIGITYVIEYCNQ